MDNNTSYKTGQLFEILGVSRDALRYYEEKGIIKPRLNKDNNYREYDFKDIYTLMITDFYKKRNLTVCEVKTLQAGSEVEELENLLDIKAKELEESILFKQYTLIKIEETRQFCKAIKEHLNKYSICQMPEYKVLGEITDFDALNEYHVILDNMDMLKDDILSKVMRKLTFDDEGYLDHKMYIVEKSNVESGENDGVFLESKPCMYTIVEDSRDIQKDAKITALKTGLKWAGQHGFTLEGVVYINTRLITYSKNQERVYLEVFVPIKKTITENK